MEEQIIKLAQTNAPFYIYDEKAILDQIDRLKQAFPGFTLLYSVKANPNTHILKTIAGAGLGMDAASLKEVELSSGLGLAKDKVYYSCPGKTKMDIEQAMPESTIIADSLYELSVINDIAGKKGITIKVGLRINPDFTMYAETGLPGKFGVDEELLFEDKTLLSKFANVTVSGTHVHIQSQILDHNVLHRYYERIFALTARLKEELDIKIEFINFGGGVGMVYDPEKESPLDLSVLSGNIGKLAAKYNRQLNARLIVETGRFLVGAAGRYVTRIVDIKKSRGKTFYIVKNSLNGFMRPSISCLVQKYAVGKEPLPTEPLFTTGNAFGFEVLSQSEETETVDIVGHLCTAADIMAMDVTVRKARIGDALVVSNAGSYAYTLSPHLFSGHYAPAEYFNTLY